jgi:DNA-binding transcriptional ArsR family regulator
MSGEALFQVLDGDTSPTTPAARLVLVGLAWITPRGSQYITGDPTVVVSRLRRSTRLSRASIYGSLRSLAEADLIEVEDLRAGRRYRLNVGDWRVSRSETDPRSSPDPGRNRPDPGFAPIYKELQREDRAVADEIDRLVRVDALRSEGRSWAEIAVVLAEEGLSV